MLLKITGYIFYFILSSCKYFSNQKLFFKGKYEKIFIRRNFVFSDKYKKSFYSEEYFIQTSIKNFYTPAFSQPFYWKNFEQV